jgi:hypothetical protein
MKHDVHRHRVADPTDCTFLLDYEIDEEEWGDKKKPYRYRWLWLRRPPTPLPNGLLKR